MSRSICEELIIWTTRSSSPMNASNSFLRWQVIVEKYLLTSRFFVLSLDTSRRSRYSSSFWVPRVGRDAMCVYNDASCILTIISGELIWLPSWDLGPISSTILSDMLATCAFTSRLKVINLIIITTSSGIFRIKAGKRVAMTSPSEIRKPPMRMRVHRTITYVRYRYISNSLRGYYPAFSCGAEINGWRGSSFL